MIIFALNATEQLGQKVANHLGITLSPHEEREFEDGEHKARPTINIRNKDVFIIQSLYGDNTMSVNDKLCRLLFFIGACHDASARRITVIAPYLCYARKDRKTKPRDPVTTRYLAALFEAVGVDHFVTMDVHNLQAFQNGFRCHTDHLEAKQLFINHLIPVLSHSNIKNNITVMSPDIGGIKRAEQFCESLEIKLGKPVARAFMDKQRSEEKVTGDKVVGDVKNKTVLIFDDLISSGTTILRAVNACVNLKAKNIYAVAAHGLFTANAKQLLHCTALNKLFITNSIEASLIKQKNAKDKIEVVDISSLLANAINIIHSGGSIVELMSS